MPRRFYTLYEQKFSKRRPYLSIISPQRYRKSKKFGHWALRSGGKKTFKLSEQMKKKKSLKKTSFDAAILHPLWAKVFKSETITFPQRFRNSKNFGHWTSGSGGKKTFKRSEQMKNICKILFFCCCGNFTPFISKSFQIGDHFFSIIFPKDSEKSEKNGRWTSESGGKKMF